MAEYIDREKIIDDFSKYGAFFTYGKDVCKAIISRIKIHPSANVAPVVHGEWVDTPNGIEIKCSYCKADWNVFENDTYRFIYCPNCGAKMKMEYDL